MRSYHFVSTLRTGELIHIDFGIAFEAGRLLKVAEQVPFRLTRDIVAGRTWETKTLICGPCGDTASLTGLTL